ncbi:MAG: nucleoside triphosphate pyrophosphohydrolase, partial [Verrucomicrobiota bacterium]
DELGDLLLQPVFHAEIASETNWFDLNDVASAICDKLIRRHPHVFGDSIADNPDAVLTQWEQIKANEKGSESSSEDYFVRKANEGLPALMSAQKLQKKVGKVGFDWPDLEPVLTKIHEELSEVTEALENGTKDELGGEIGDLLFAVVNLARKTGHEAELLLHGTNRKFVDRFQQVEEALKKSGRSLEEANLGEMDRAWEEVKYRERQRK